MLKLNLQNLFAPDKLTKIFTSYQKQVQNYHEQLHKKTCIGAGMLGWLDFPKIYSTKQLQQLVKKAQLWRDDQKTKHIVMLGIGGSYVGVRAGIDYVLDNYQRIKQIHYVASLSPAAIYDLIQQLEQEDFYLVVCSKSGTTLEIGVAFRLFYNLLYQKYGSVVADERIVCITSPTKGVLRDIVNAKKLKAFVVPDDIGGRFSAITPIGLFVMEVLGISAQAVLKGAQQALDETSSFELTTNLAYKYAVLRHYLHTVGHKDVEVFCVCEDFLDFFGEHVKQLFAESEGKKQKGLLPFNCVFTTDLHSVGQYLQEGKGIFFETYLEVLQPNHDLTFTPFFNNLDNLSFLENKTLSQVNRIAKEATIAAHHFEAQVPVISISILDRSPTCFGYLYTWFAKTVAMSGLLLGINPFDQPGVEAYKRRMLTKLQE